MTITWTLINWGTFVTLLVFIECLSTSQPTVFLSYLAVSSGGLLRSLMNQTLQFNKGNLALWYVVHIIVLYLTRKYLIPHWHKIHKVLDRVGQCTGMFVPFYVLYGVMNAGSLNNVFSGIITATSGGTILGAVKCFNEHSIRPLKRRVYPVLIATIESLLLSETISAKRIAVCMIISSCVMLFQAPFTMKGEERWSIHAKISRRLKEMLDNNYDWYYRKYTSLSKKNEEAENAQI